MSDSLEAAAHGYAAIEERKRNEQAMTHPLESENRRLREALEGIAAMEGKTLISVGMGQPYSIGASRAFDQCANMARDALRYAAPPASEDKRVPVRFDDDGEMLHQRVLTEAQYKAAVAAIRARITPKGEP